MADVVWDAQTLPIPESRHQGWVRKIVLEFNSVRMPDAWSTEGFDNRVATLMLPEHLPLVIPTLTHVYAEGKLKDRFGAALFARKLLEKGSSHRPAIRPLIPFLAQGLEKHNDLNDQQQVLNLLGLYGERRAVPLLMHFLNHSNEDLVYYAKSSLSKVTKIAEHELDAGKAQDWWDRYHEATDQQIYVSMLNSRDESLQMGACESLYQYQDMRILPVLAKLSSSDSRSTRTRVGILVKKLRVMILVLVMVRLMMQLKWHRELFNWVEESSAGFQWLEFREAKPAQGGNGSA